MDRTTQIQFLDNTPIIATDSADLVIKCNSTTASNDDSNSLVHAL